MKIPKSHKEVCATGIWMTTLRKITLFKTCCVALGETSVFKAGFLDDKSTLDANSRVV
jgi:hypothetical protein